MSLEPHRTVNMVVKEICEQEELENLMIALASGNAEELDVYCDEDKVIRVHNDLRLSLFLKSCGRAAGTLSRCCRMRLLPATAEPVSFTEAAPLLSVDFLDHAE